MSRFCYVCLEGLDKAVMKMSELGEVCGDTYGRALGWAEANTVDAVEVVRCYQCRFYEGVHNVQGCAPCAFRGIGAVMWDDYCKRGERWDG